MDFRYSAKYAESDTRGPREIKINSLKARLLRSHTHPCVPTVILKY